MFTGIIEDLGKVINSGRSSITIQTRLDGIKTGDSVAVNGVCLTATSAIKSKNSFIIEFDISPETLQKTNLGQVKPGSRINVENSLKVGDKLSGHFVSGHVDDVGKILKIQQENNSYVFTFAVSEKLLIYVAPKGSVSIDGISLTVVNRTEKSFSVAVIPHTYKNTTLGFKKPGDPVNIETDMFAKYVENIMQNQQKSKITKDFLQKHGF
ncbi:MAG: riboflavin synthase [Endomicrobiales bacterium]|nr:riboflavin synthase [Endomicrobiales bacterium]